MESERWKNYFWIITRGVTRLTLVPTLIFYVGLLLHVQESRFDATRRMWRNAAVFDSLSEATVRDCLNAGADINQQYADGKSYLMAAAENNNLEYVRILVKLGADVSLQDDYGDTALALASEAGYDEIVRFLQQHGAR
jgi:ankyrin repeat protein